MKHGQSIQNAALNGVQIQAYSPISGWQDVSKESILGTSLLRLDNPKAYRIKPKVTRKPLNQTAFPRGTVVRFRSEAKDVFHQVLSRTAQGITFNAGGRQYVLAYNSDALIGGELRRKLPGKDSLWIRCYAKVEA